MNKYYNILLAIVACLPINGLIASDKPFFNEFTHDVAKKTVQLYAGLYAAGTGMATFVVAALGSAPLRNSFSAVKAVNWKACKAITKTTPVTGAVALAVIAGHKYQENFAEKK